MVSLSCEITLEGMPVNPAQHPVIIKNGANWIAFPCIESMTLTNAFVGFAAEGDMVQSQTVNSRYVNGRWVGQLTNLEPGQGYIFKSNATGNRVFYYPN